MVRKQTVYTTALFGWALLVFGFTVAVFSGQTAPLITVDMLPVGGPPALIVLAGGLLVAGVFVVSLLKRRAWRRTGHAVGLTPTGGGLFSTPDLGGTVDGRSVHARTITRRTNSGGEGGSNSTTYTVVEADLSEPATDGLIVTRGGNADFAGAEQLSSSIESDTVGEFQVVGTSRELAEAVLTSRVQTTLRKPSLADSVQAGDAADVLLEAVPDSDGMLMGKLTDGIQSKIQEQYGGDAATVRIETKGLLLDNDELDRQLRAVVAVAGAFEAATTP